MSGRARLPGFKLLDARLLRRVIPVPCGRAAPRARRSAEYSRLVLGALSALECDAGGIGGNPIRGEGSKTVKVRVRLVGFVRVEARDGGEAL